MHISHYRRALRGIALATSLICNSNAAPADPPAVETKQPAASGPNIDAALRQPAAVSFNNTPLREVAQQLSKAHGFSIRLDRQALTDAGIDLQACPVTRKHDGLTLSQFLRLMLEEFDLTYIVRGSGLLITTPERAGREMEARVYPVRDLVSSRVKEGELADDGSMDYDSLIELITTTVAPTAWSESGPATDCKPFRGVLIITQTPEIHEQISHLLAALRTAIRGWMTNREISPTPANPADAFDQPLQVALDNIVRLKIARGSLLKAVEQLRDEHKIPIFIDAKALTDAGLSSEVEVEFSDVEMPLRDALREALDDYELVVVTKNGALNITTPEVAGTIMQIWVYPVGDISPRRETGGVIVRKLPANSNVDFGCPTIHVGDALIHCVTGSVAPTSWDEVGGPGTIAPYGQLLVVSHTVDVHRQTARLFADMRKTIAEQERGKKFASPPETDPLAMETRVYRLEVKRTEKGKETISAPVMDDDQAVAMIQAFVEPDKWAIASDAKTSPAASPCIRAASGVLVVRQTRAVHTQISAFLSKLGIPASGGGGGFF